MKQPVNVFDLRETMEAREKRRAGNGKKRREELRSGVFWKLAMELAMTSENGR